ncbi:putative histidinol-phosphatase [Vanrija pseudolonga]|uniref:Histidinol-phosphatase n=1 Tax=Vanrija pseudolonga TaxID=143232 RepID=A0AAF0Y600_9TREE|nr:putative histidinol-phosphatase [Vanrija pseudolonga]
MPHSHHSHSGQFCRHAKDTLAQVVDQAVRKGFRVFGLSEHTPRYRECDLFPEEADLSPHDLLTTYEDFLREAVRIRAERSADIDLLIGIESDYISELDSDGLERLLDAHPEIDYVVGSVHHVDGVSIDFDRRTWLRSVRDVGTGSQTMARQSDGSLALLVPLDDDDARLQLDYTPTADELEPFLIAYLDAQYKLLQRHQPEVVGHFDLCLLWCPSASLESVWDRVKRNVEYAISYGALFEANAAAIRKGWSTSYPTPNVLRLILDNGGRICLSDDSHGVSYVGLNYGPMRDYLVAQQVETIWYLVPATAASCATDQPVGKRGRVVARPLQGWASDPFWAPFTTTSPPP